MVLAALMDSTGAQGVSKEYGLTDKTYNLTCKRYYSALNYYLYYVSI